MNNVEINNTVEDNKDVQKNIESSEDQILKLKKDIADKYVEKIKSEQWMWITSMIIWEGDVLKDYLVSEDLWDKISDAVKWKFMESIFAKVDKKMFDELKEVKLKIDAAKTEIELTALENEIIWVSDDSKVKENMSDNKSVKSSVNYVPIIPMYMAYEKFVVWDDVSNEEFNYVNENAKSIVEKLETKWDLSKIDEIKDLDGNVVLKCLGKTPYMNSKAASDLIGLSLLFYKKTGHEFSIESAYRTIGHQKELKEKNKKTKIPTADPWYSWHNLWYSIDVDDKSRYSRKIWWVDWLKKIALMFDFNPISSEDWHFDHKEFVDNFYKEKEARLPLAMQYNKEFDDDEDYEMAA